jgi:hypothetical protein
MWSEGVVESMVGFGYFRNHNNKHVPTGYTKIANLFLSYKVLIRYTTLIFIKFIIFTKLYLIIIGVFGKEDNPNNEYLKSPIISEISISFMLDSIFLNDILMG